MKRLTYKWQFFALFLFGASTAIGPQTAARGADTCEGHGTSVNFFDSPSTAAKHALEDEKLVFVLHVSGNFETPDFT